MVKRLKKYLPYLILITVIVIFFIPVVSKKIPLPTDTIVGLYSPYRDFYQKEYPNGVPFKNALITDPIRQTFIWKELAVDILKTGNLPTWNPYEMTGKPLIGNFQSGVFYPLNLIFIISPFYFSWSIFIFIQLVLLSIFTFLYLKNQKLENNSAILGTVAITFSGFSISWLEWGNIIHTALWLPLILLSIDKIIQKKSRRWMIVYPISLTFALFAGHLQIFFYVFILSIIYFIFRFLESKRDKRILASFSGLTLLAFIITSIQWIPTLRFINLSSRSLDQNFQTVEGWFIPFQNLIQIIAPDFFGNPATLNYYGVWNYAEFVGFIGVLPLIFAFYAFFKFNSTIKFFTTVLIISLIFALPTGISSIPYLLNIPLLSTAQPTRLIFLVCFSLGILSAYGFENFSKGNLKLTFKNLIPFIITLVIVGILGLVTVMGFGLFVKAEEMIIARRNIFLPGMISVIGMILTIIFLKIKNQKLKNTILILFLAISIFDLLRFAGKFTPFSDISYLYPKTKTIEFLKSQPGLFRIAVLDRRILAPNFATHYKLQSIEGYDPLYLKSYAEFITMLEHDKADVSLPYGFNRIITPHNVESDFLNFLNVKYVLTFNDLESNDFKKVFEEGTTKIYENTRVIDRIYFVEKVVSSNNPENLFSNNLQYTAVVEDYDGVENLSLGKVTIEKYTESEVIINTNNTGDGFLVISDAFYPTWSATVDGKITKIYKTNYSFRGFKVPSGEHRVILRDNLF